MERVVVTGGAGFLGSHLVDRLRAMGCDPFVVRSKDYDLRTEAGVKALLKDQGRIDYLFHLAATVGGIGLNKAHPGLLCYENVVMGTLLVEQARLHDVGKLICVGTVCAYPRSEYILREEHLWDGYPDPTNAPYGLAKRMLLVLLQSYWQEYRFPSVFVIPTNLYGPRDNFDPATSHVIPAMIKKFLEADDEVVLWGSGDPTRDFLYVEDAVEGILLAAERCQMPDPINLGSGDETRISVLAHIIQNLTGFRGRIRWDTTKPDGQPRRVLDISRARDLLNWQPGTPLEKGLRKTIRWYQDDKQRRMECKV